MKLIKSKTHNPNYLAKVVKLKGIRKHNNADRLQIVSIDFQDVITGVSAKDGDVCVYFPIESQINKEFLSLTNSFKDRELNEDQEVKGFFDKNGRVRAIKLRGEKSMGYIVPAKMIEKFAKLEPGTLSNYINEEFDYIGKIKMVNKYIIKYPNTAEGNRKKNRLPKMSRLIDGQVRLHEDTENLRKNVRKVSSDDIVSLTYKTHGTSWWVSNVLVKKDLKWWEKALKWLGVPIIDTEYDVIYGSRRVVKNQELKSLDNSYYGYDLWEDIKNEVGDIPKGFTLYGECLGFTKEGKYIQKDYDYGCEPNTFELEVYRITYTNPDGLKYELSYLEIEEFCLAYGLTPSRLFYYGPAKGLLDGPCEDERGFQEKLVPTLEEKYNGKDCYMCNNKVPEEGVVLRIEKLGKFEAYKLKSFEFLQYETKKLDKGELDLESEN